MNDDFLLLIDGSSLLTTQFYGNLPREILFAKTPEEKEKFFHKIMMTGKGVYTNAVYGFLRTLFKILKEQKPAFLAVAWDVTRDTFRRELYPEYKGNRQETMAPLKDQFILCQQVLKRMNIPEFMDSRYEADDFCGSIAKKFESEIPVKIFTKDHDYLQLVTERTHMWLMHSTAEKTEEMYKKYRIDHSRVNVPERAFELTPELVEAEFGVKPEHINSLKGLQGDSSDNIKGVPGVGEATAVKLIREYGTIDGLYRACKGLDKAGTEELKKKWKEELDIARSPLSFLLKESDTELLGERSAKLSELLATIKTDIDLGELSLTDLAVRISPKGTEEVLRELEFQSLHPDISENEEQEDPSAGFVLTEGFEGFSGIRKRALSEKALGLYYEKDLGLSLAFPDGEVHFLPERFFITRDSFGELLRELSGKGIRLYSYDGKKLVSLSGVLTRDAEIASYLLEPLLSGFPYEYASSRELSLKLPSREMLCGKGPMEKCMEASPENFLRAVCYPAWTALNAGPVLEKKLQEAGMLELYEKIELPVMGVLARMEDAGILVKREELKAYGEKLQRRIGELEKEIRDLAGENFNINSPKQLSEILFVKLKLPYFKKAKTGFSTAADILEKLAPDYPIVEKVLEYRTLAKLRSTYAEGLASCISEDGRIHGTFNQTVTATGRISSTEPNLQNIPVRLELGRMIRKVFVPKEGCRFIDADYSQIELRILAHLSGDENLIRAYRDARDIHALTASQVFHVPLSEVTPLQRRNAKAVNFGIVYGISAFSLADDLSITRQEAESYMESYFDTYPGVAAYLKSTVEEAREKGYVRTAYGRIRPIPELSSANFNQRSFGERVAMNSPIQGTAADIMKIAMIRVEEALKKAGLSARIVLQVHDELLVEAPREEADEVQKILKREMEHAAELLVNLDVEINTGETWYDTK